MEEKNLAYIKSELLKGNNKCLEVIFKDEADFCVKNLSNTTSCSYEDAEDIFVESVLNLREKIIAGKITYLNSVRNYLYTTCKNMWSERVRKLAGTQKKWSSIQAYLHDEYKDDPIVQKEDLQETETMLKIANEALSKMNSKCQDIIYYFYVEGHSMTDIVELMDLSNSEVAKVLKYRCFKKLKNLVREFQKAGR